MFKPVIATEIEFYLHDADLVFLPEQIIGFIHDICAKAGIDACSVEQERGRNQYEIALSYSYNKAHIVADTERFKPLLDDFFRPHGICADFRAKPFADQPGSGLHVHVHLENEKGENIFFRENNAFSPPLLHAIGGLLLLMNPCMPVFAPYEESYLRFSHKSNAPTTVSWGTNNRTVAIRLPQKPVENKHIEHRVSGSDANVANVVEVILAGIYYGIEHTINPGEPVYGDASLAQYGLPPLAKSLAEAEKYKNQCLILKDWGNFILY